MWRVTCGHVGRAAALLVAWRGVAAADAPDRELEVVVRGEAVAVRARDASVTAIVAAVAAATGATVHGRVATDRRLTVRFDPLPVGEALPRVLGSESFALRYGRGGRLVAIELRGGPVHPASRTSPAPAPAVDAPAALLGALLAHGPIAVDGRLAASLGGGRAALADVADAALRDTDADLRTAAMGAVLQAVEGDAELRPRLLSALAAVGDDDAATALRALAGARAEEVTGFVATRAGDAALRARAAGVLRGLRDAR